MGSEVEGKRHLIKLVLSNLKLDGEKLVCEAHKPFDLLLNCSDNLIWRPIGEIFQHQGIEISVSLPRLQTAFSFFGLSQPI